MEMSKLDKVIKEWEAVLSRDPLDAPWDLIDDTLTLLKEQKDRHRLEVHNIWNVDIPEGVSEEHFHLVMNNVVEALQHTDKGESYPYEDTGR